MLRSGYPRLIGEAGAALATRTFELAEFIVDVLGITELGRGIVARGLGGTLAGNPSRPHDEAE